MPFNDVCNGSKSSKQVGVVKCATCTYGNKETILFFRNREMSPEKKFEYQIKHNFSRKNNHLNPKP